MSPILFHPPGLERVTTWALYKIGACWKELMDKWQLVGAVLFLFINSSVSIPHFKNKGGKDTPSEVYNILMEHIQYVHNWTINLLPDPGNKSPI